jgi:hypothetical protein
MAVELKFRSGVLWAVPVNVGPTSLVAISEMSEKPKAGVQSLSWLMTLPPGKMMAWG